MQDELNAAFPTLNIKIIAVNEAGQESGNSTVATEGRTLPMLQDVNTDGQAGSDMWTSWNGVWRDATIVDKQNRSFATLNLTSHDLSKADNYNALKNLILAAANAAGPPAAPAVPDLMAITDTGFDTTDNRTKLNNSTVANALQVRVGGVTSGAIVKLFANGTLVGQGTASGTSIDITTNGTTVFADGAVSFTATQDVAGQASAVSSTLTVTIDTIAPAAITPAVPTTAAIGAAFVYDAQNAEEGQTGFRYSLVTPPSGMTINQTTGAISWTPTVAQVGSHAFQIQAADAAGNLRTLAANVTVAAVAPTSVDLVAASDSGFSNTDNITNVTSPQFLVSGVTSGNIVKLYNGTTLIGQATASGTTVTITPTSPFAGGSYSISASQMFGSTESDRTTALAVTIDVTNPALFSTTVPSQAAVGAPYSFDAQHAEEGQVGFRYSLVTPPTGMTINDTTGLISWTPTAAQVGSHSFQLRATDAAGNQRTLSASITVLSGVPGGVDLPTASDSGISNTDNLTNVTQPAFVVSGVTAGATVRLYDGNTLIGQATASGTSATITPTSPLASGAHTLTASQDTGSGEGARSPALTVTIDTTAPATITPAVPTTALVGTPFSYNAENVEEGQAGFRYSLNNALAGMTINETTGVISWTPTAAQAGARSFEIRATDAAGNVRSLPVSLTVAGQLPGVADTFSATEDTLLTVTAANGVLKNDGDGQSGTLTASLLSNVTHGTLTLNADGSFSYTPASNYNGTDSFTYQATDGTRTTSPTTVTFNIAAVNDAPVAVANTYQVGEDQTLTVALAQGVLANDTDVDNTTLTAQLVTNVAHGTLNLNANGTFTYTPANDFTGTDSFTYRANDGTANSNVVTVEITVSGTNDAPTSLADTYTATEDQDLVVALAQGVLANDTDPEGTTLTAQVVTGPAHGTLTLNANGSFTYTPASNYSGSDSFTYRASDGSLQSSPTTVQISVTAVNDAPTAASDQFAITSGGTLNVSVANGVLKNDTDVDNTTLTAQVVANPTHGTLTLNANGSFTYVSTAGFSGNDTFTYRANDGTDNSTTATVTISVNNGPAGTADAYQTNEDQTLNVNAATGVLANDTDPENDTLTAELVVGPTHGTLTLNANGSFTYTPASNYHGADTFTYRARDPQQATTPITVTLTVNSVNDLPTAVADQYRTDRGVALTINTALGLLKNDTDLESTTLTAVVAASPTHGTLVLNADGSFTYTPSTGYTGVDTFTYRADDGDDLSSPTTVTITVNAPPSVQNDSYQATEDTPLHVMLAQGVRANDTDAEGDAFTVAVVTAPTHGTLTLNADGSFTYTPTANYSGSDTFTYRASDGSLTSGEATVTITVAGANDAPFAGGDEYEVDEDGSLVVAPANGVLTDDTDIDSTTLTAVLVGGPAHGTVALNANGSFTYTPSSNFFGTDTFTYRALDNGGVASNVATVTITVRPLADAPVISPVANRTVFSGGTVVVDVNATDIDNTGVPLTYSIESGPAGATINSTTGVINWTSPSDASGRVPVTVRATKGTSDALFATLTFQIDVVPLSGVLAEAVSQPTRVIAIPVGTPPGGRPLRPAPPDRPRSGSGSGTVDTLLRASRNSITSGLTRIQSGGDLRLRRTDASRPENNGDGGTSTEGGGSSTDGARATSPEDTRTSGIGDGDSRDVAFVGLDLTPGDLVTAQLLGNGSPSENGSEPAKAAHAKVRSSQPVSRHELSRLANVAMDRSAKVTRAAKSDKPTRAVSRDVADIAKPTVADATTPVSAGVAVAENAPPSDLRKAFALAAASATAFAPLMVTQLSTPRRRNMATRRRPR